MRPFILGLLFTASALAQSAVFPGAVVTDSQLSVATNNVQTLLAATLAATATTFNVVTATGFAINQVATIDQENVWICSVVGLTISVGRSSCPNVDGRGFDGSAAVAHSAAGANCNVGTSKGCVSEFVVAWQHNAQSKEIEAIEGAVPPATSGLLFTTFAAACANAAMNHFTLLPVKAWLNVPTQTCAEAVDFIHGGGSIQPGAGQKVDLTGSVNAPLKKICDMVLGGVCTFNSATGVVYPQWWGAQCAGNSATDDSAATQAAITNFGANGATSMNPGQVQIIGGCYIGSTILLQGKSVEVKGQGWWYTSTSAVPLSFLASMPSLAGKPMVVLQNSQGSRLSALRFIGSIANPPSAAIDMDQQDGGYINELNSANGIYIGYVPGVDPVGKYFTNGILYSGKDHNNNNSTFSHYWIYGATNGVNINAAQWSAQFYDGEISDTACTVASGAKVHFVNVYMGAASNANLCAISNPTNDTSPWFILDNWASENSYRLLDDSTVGGGFITVDARSGGFEMSPSAIAGGKILDLSGNSTFGVNLHFEDFYVSNPFGLPSPYYLIDLSHNTTTATMLARFHGGPTSGLNPAVNFFWSANSSASEIDYLDIVSEAGTFTGIAGGSKGSFARTSPVTNTLTIGNMIITPTVKTTAIQTTAGGLTSLETPSLSINGATTSTPNSVLIDSTGNAASRVAMFDPTGAVGTVIWGSSLTSSIAGPLTIHKHATVDSGPIDQTGAGCTADGDFFLNTTPGAAANHRGFYCTSGGWTGVF